MLGHSKCPCLFETKSKKNEEYCKDILHWCKVSMGFVTYEILNAKKIQVCKFFALKLKP